MSPKETNQPITLDQIAENPPQIEVEIRNMETLWYFMQNVEKYHTKDCLHSGYFNSNTGEYPSIFSENDLIKEYYFYKQNSLESSDQNKWKVVIPVKLSEKKKVAGFREFEGKISLELYNTPQSTSLQDTIELLHKLFPKDEGFELQLDDGYPDYLDYFSVHKEIQDKSRIKEKRNIIKDNMIANKLIKKGEDTEKKLNELMYTYKLRDNFENVGTIDLFTPSLSFVMQEGCPESLTKKFEEIIQNLSLLLSLARANFPEVAIPIPQKIIIDPLQHLGRKEQQFIRDWVKADTEKVLVNTEK